MGLDGEDGASAKGRKAKTKARRRRERCVCLPARSLDIKKSFAECISTPKSTGLGRAWNADSIEPLCASLNPLARIAAIIPLDCVGTRHPRLVSFAASSHTSQDPTRPVSPHKRMPAESE